MKNYSQHGEQAHILKFFGDFKGRFLDIGAFDGVTGSNTRALVELGWSGVSIEANPENFQLLLNQKLNNVNCVSAAVMSKAGLERFYFSADQCGTCLENKNLQAMLPVRSWYYVAAVTPWMIAERFGGDFDFISLDVEGVDLEVLQALGPVAGKARLLCFEDSIPCHVFDADYYQSMIAAAAACGFSKTIARTPSADGTGNTLIARE